MNTKVGNISKIMATVSITVLAAAGWSVGLRTGRSAAPTQTGPGRGVAVPPPPDVDWIDGPNGTYIVMPPILTATGHIAGMSWSPNGEHLIFLYQQSQVLGTDSPDTLLKVLAGVTPAPEYPQAIYEWDRDSGKATRLAAFPMGTIYDAIHCTWLTGTQSAYVSFVSRGRPSQEIYLLNAASHSISKLSWFTSTLRLEESGGSVEKWDVVPDPVKSDALIRVSAFLTEPDQPVDLTFLADAQGNEVRKMAGGAYKPAWTVDGKPVGLGKGSRTRSNSGGSVYYSITGDSLKVIPEPSLASAEASPDLIGKVNLIVHAAGKLGQNLQAAWLVSSKPVEEGRLALAVSASNLKIDVSGTSAVAYLVGDSLYVRKMAAVSPDIRKLLVEMAELKAISQARQSGLGLIMWSGDNNDSMPPSGSLGDLMDYLNDSSLLANFNYTPPSDLNMQDMSSPSTTELGYVDGPGGRAVLFGDGHVGWVKN